MKIPFKHGNPAYQEEMFVLFSRMPRITAARRAARRMEILNAAWTCFDRKGLHATTMEDIIRASGLSAGAVYTYFASKEELIEAAVTESLSELRTVLDGVWDRDPPPEPPELVRETTRLIAGHAQREGFSLVRIAVHGWSESQRNERLRETVAGFYRVFRGRLARLADDWRTAGVIQADADTNAVSQALLSLLLGFVVQSAILGDASPSAHETGLSSLRQPAGADKP